MGALDWLVNTTVPGLKDLGSSAVDFGLKAWDSFTDSPTAIAGVASAAGGIADYYGQQDKAEADAKAYTYKTKVDQEQLARHNESIAALAEEYRKGGGVLRGGS
jgi:hypothetical protein